MTEHRTCRTCKTEYKVNSSGRKDCGSCYNLKKKTDDNRRCLDCDTLISWRSTTGRCRSCAARRRVGEDNPMYTNGRTMTSKGYVLLTHPKYKGHPNAQKHGILEHVLIMSEHLGRPIKPGETIHHKNGIRDDNNLDNLELWTKNHPYGTRVADLYKWATDFIDSYQDEINLLD